MSQIAPRWTFTESNSSRWRELFDQLMAKPDTTLHLPLEGNAKSLASLRIRISDGLLWLVIQWTQFGREEFKPYSDLKRRLQFRAANIDGKDTLILKLRGGVLFKPVNDIKTNSTANEQNKLSPSTIKKFAEAMEDQNKAIELRKKIAKTLICELMGRENDSSLISSGIKVEAIIKVAQNFLVTTGDYKERTSPSGGDQNKNGG